MECRRKRPHIFVGVKRNNKQTINIRTNHWSRLGEASTMDKHGAKADKLHSFDLCL